MIGGPRAVVGVLRLDLVVPGSRSLKDRRQGVHSLRDRVRARFDVSCHELTGDDPVRSTLLVTTGGTDRVVVASALDKIRALAEADAVCLVGAAESEVFGWPQPTPWIEEDEDV